MKIIIIIIMEIIIKTMIVIIIIRITIIMIIIIIIIIKIIIITIIIAIIILIKSAMHLLFSVRYLSQTPTVRMGSNVSKADKLRSGVRGLTLPLRSANKSTSLKGIRKHLIT